MKSFIFLFVTLQAEVPLESLALKINRLMKERDAILAQVNLHQTKCKQIQKMSTEGLLRFDKMCIDELKNLNDIATCLKVRK